MIIPKQSKKFRVICTLTCLYNIKCESTSTLRSWTVGIGDLIQPPTSINTRKSNTLKARAQVIFFCFVRVACQTVSVFYFPTTEVATCSPRLPIFTFAFILNPLTGRLHEPLLIYRRIQKGENLWPSKTDPTVKWPNKGNDNSALPQCHSVLPVVSSVQRYWLLY